MTVKEILLIILLIFLIALLVILVAVSIKLKINDIKKAIDNRKQKKRILEEIRDYSVFNNELLEKIDKQLTKVSESLDEIRNKKPTMNEIRALYNMPPITKEASNE